MGVTEKRANEVFRNGVTKEVDPTVPAVVGGLSDVGGVLYYNGQPVGGGGGGGDPWVKERITVPRTVAGLDVTFVMPTLTKNAVYQIDASRGEIITIDFSNEPDFGADAFFETAWNEIYFSCNVSNGGAGSGNAVFQSFIHNTYFGFLVQPIVIANGDYKDFSGNTIPVGVVGARNFRIEPATSFIMKLVSGRPNGSVRLSKLFLL